MKTVRNERHFEPSHESLDILKGRIDDYFRRNHQKTPWYPDHQNWDLYDFNSQHQEIVLFGNFLRSFFESGIWPFEEMTFWCLSQRVKSVMVKLLGFPDDCVGILAREDLFQISKEKISSFNFNWVYAGRLSPSKNTKLLLLLYKLVDQNPQHKGSLELYGSFDDEISPNYGRRVQATSFEIEIKRWVNSQTWNNPPVFHGKLPSQDWMKSCEGKTFISLSNFMMEDFGVSTAQVQEKGLFQILSDWGGHAEIQNNCLKIPNAYLSAGLEDEELLKIKAQEILSYLLSHPNSHEIKPIPPTIPKKLSRQELDQIRAKFVNKWGLSVLWSLRAGFAHFTDTDTGSLFFSEYNDLFSDNKNRYKTVYILNEFDGPKNIQTEIKAVLKFTSSQSDLAPVYFINSRYMFKKDQLKIILAADLVVFVLKDEFKEKCYKQLTNIYAGDVIALEVNELN